MTDDLKPCPFCGGEDIRMRPSVSFPALKVECGSCHVEFVFRVAPKHREAKSDWNTRPREAELEAQIENLKEKINEH